jgi:tripartite-type tricarboxylate transporter receptor subunit TctC
MIAPCRLFAAALAALCLATASGAHAQGYPARPVRIVVPTPPGPLDAFARLLGEKLGERLRQPFLVENRPGAGGNIGTEAVARAQPDGHTLLFAIDTTFTVNPHLYPKLGFDPAADFAFVAVPVTFGQMLAVHPSVPASSVAEFVSLARTRKLNYGSGGNGSPTHLTFAYFLAAAGVDVQHVPYKGGQQAVVDTVAGNVDAVFTVTTAVLPQVRGGRLRALAVSSATRSPLAPEVPSVAELGYPGFDASFAYVVAAPRGTPEPVLALLHAELERALALPDVQEKMRAADYAVTTVRQKDAAGWVERARERWGGVIRSAAIRLE